MWAAMGVSTNCSSRSVATELGGTTCPVPQQARYRRRREPARPVCFVEPDGAPSAWAKGTRSATGRQVLTAGLVLAAVGSFVGTPSGNGRKLGELRDV